MIHPVNYSPSQDFGDNPTRDLPADHWIIRQFGNYQPDGHTGVDYPCPVGTEVRAVSTGTVLHVGYFDGTYADNPYWINPGFAGWTYVIDHVWFVGIYGHCQEGGARVRVGDVVPEGQVLGLSGNTGASTGPHLHFEVLPDGWIVNSFMYGRINPSLLVAPLNSITPQGDLTLTGSTTSQEDDMFTDSDRQNLEKSIHQQGIIIGMLDNIAAWQNESGAETRDNVRKVTLETVYGEDVK
jgi:murein DD-endopeptidase MepM/ murein hydrolase activator NlpD